MWPQLPSKVFHTSAAARAPLLQKYLREMASLGGHGVAAWSSVRNGLIAEFLDTCSAYRSPKAKAAAAAAAPPPAPAAAAATPPPPPKEKKAKAAQHKAPAFGSTASTGRGEGGSRASAKSVWTKERDDEAAAATAPPPEPPAADGGEEAGEAGEANGAEADDDSGEDSGAGDGGGGVDDEVAKAAATCALAVGDAITALWQPTNEWYSGAVTAANGDGTFNLRFDDGDQAMQVPRNHIRASHPGAAQKGNGGGANEAADAGEGDRLVVAAGDAKQQQQRQDAIALKEELDAEEMKPKGGCCAVQ